MVKNKTIINKYGMAKAFIITAVLPFIFMVACDKVPIDTNDSTNPIVRIKVYGQDGYKEQSIVEHHNNTSQPPIKIMATVDDPQGVKSIELRFLKTSVGTAYCGGAIASGVFYVDGLPPQQKATATVTSGKVTTKLFLMMEIPQILKLSSDPVSPGPCYPANGESIKLRCIGENWSSISGKKTTTKYLEIKFVL